MLRTLRAIINETVHHFAGINSLRESTLEIVPAWRGVRAQMVISGLGGGGRLYRVTCILLGRVFMAVLVEFNGGANESCNSSRALDGPG